MWLGDVAKLPENEQYYLRSENIKSDHSLGSEFYAGQIEAKFTPLSKEDELFHMRSKFFEACHEKFSVSLGHLQEETLDLALSLNPPITDTLKERSYISDKLNKIYLESFDNKALGVLVKKLNIKPSGSGSNKRLQDILTTLAPTDVVNTIMMPFYVIYDFRVAYLHLTQGSQPPQLASITKRLGLSHDATLLKIYTVLIESLLNSFAEMIKIVEQNSSS